MSDVKNQSEQTKNFPAEVDVERYILGAMLCGKGAELVPNIIAALSPDDFFNVVNRAIFETIVKVHSDGKPVNTLTVFAALRKTLKRHETLQLVLALPEFVSTLAYVDGYIKILKDTTSQRLAISTAEQLVTDVRAGVLPADEIFSTAVNTLSNLSQANKPTEIFDTQTEMGGEFRKFLATAQLYTDRKTGFDNLDKIQLFSPGLYVIGAVPAAGKTTFCWQMAEQLALKGEHCFYFTYEIGRNELWAKSIARGLYLKLGDSAPATGRILFGVNDLDSDFAHAIYKTMDNFTANLQAKGGKLTVVECSPDFTVENIINTVRPVLAKDKKAPVVFIDYLQKVKSDNESVKNGVDDVMRKLKYFQRQTNTTFVVVSSFNRMNYNQQVALESSKESGGIEYEADVFWGMQLAIMDKIQGGTDISNIRKMVAEAKQEQPRKIQLKCLKYRNGGDYHCCFEYFSAHAHFVSVDSFDEVNPPFDDNSENNDIPANNANNTRRI